MAQSIKCQQSASLLSVETKLGSTPCMVLTAGRTVQHRSCIIMSILDDSETLSASQS